MAQQQANFDRMTERLERLERRLDTDEAAIIF